MLARALSNVAGIFMFCGPQPRPALEENFMAKEQRRGNREIRKPKKKKEPTSAPSC
jgi:hypothetical protein